MSVSSGAYALELLDWSRAKINHILDAIPLEEYLHQPIPGANHALWNMGHLGTVDLSFMLGLGGPKSEELARYKEQFFMKSTPLSDAAAYPPIETVRKFFDDARATLRTWIMSLDDAALEAPTSERLQRFSPTVGGTLSRIAWHEGMHLGQLTLIRKSLGLAPLNG